MSAQIQGVHGAHTSPEEWRTRVDLAACYRLVALFGWDDLVFTHISARLPGADEGVALRDEEKPRLVADLGERTFLMLRNHGLLTVGTGIPEAFQAMYLFEATCNIQLRAQAGGELIPVLQAIIDAAPEIAQAVTKGQGAQLTWPGLLRRLDREMPGYDQ